MRNLILAPTPPTYLVRYETIRDKKHIKTRKALMRAKKFVDGRYAAHDAAVTTGALHSLALAACKPGLKAALRGCYSTRSQGRTALIDAIKTAQDDGSLRYCFYCQASGPETWDHYLPSEKFPEFSVLASNLVPCCLKCNSAKDDAWLDAAGQRQFLHFGFDAIPKTFFLQVTLVKHPATTAPGARFRLERGTMALGPWTLISQHFQRLKLISRYDEKANEEISIGLSACRSHLRYNGRDAAGFLRDQAQEQGKLFGPNHWRARLWHAMADDPELPVWIAALK